MTVHNALDVAFQRARAEGRGVLIPYLTAGFPQREGFVDLAIAILEGADALEIGIPFSDPLLDGVSIQGSQQRALEAGVTPALCLELARQIHARTDKPLLFMGAYNPIYAYGVAGFCADAARAGLSGLIIPDVPLEEQGELQEGTSGHGLHLIQLMAPTSTETRVRRVCANASGFIYCISVAGVTGARASVAATARPLVERVRCCSDVPVAVGFGIAGPQQAREVIEFADGVIVGSRLIDLLRDTPAEQRIDAARQFIGSLRDALQLNPARR
jgi:tryptophan synthase alpha chain